MLNKGGILILSIAGISVIFLSQILSKNFPNQRIESSANLISITVLQKDQTATENSNTTITEQKTIEANPQTRTILDFLKPESLQPKKIIKKEPIKESADDINAEAIFLKDISSNKILMVKNESRVWPLASLTKLMTVLLAKEVIPINSKITISDNSENQISNTLFKAGEEYLSDDLIRASLLASNNAASNALAEFFGYNSFVKLMQRKALDLGMNNTSFKDVTGLSSLNKSTVMDFEILAKYIYQNFPDLIRITSNKEILINELITNRQIVLKNNNQFAGEPFFIGGKTGYTEEAHGNLFSMFKAGNETFISIVFGSEDRFEDTRKLYSIGLKKVLGIGERN